MASCLLDTGCTKSMILKKFTEIKRQNKVSKEDTIEYETYGGKFRSSMTASVGFKMIEFQQHQNQTIEYEFQVDETSNSKQQHYDMIIGNDLLWNMGINRIQAIRVFAVRVTPFFTNKKHALNTLKMGPLLRSDVMQS
jgi:ABC-type lipoprotein release transport system permease subunit